MADAPIVGRDFRVGDVLSRAWTVLTANLLFFIGLSALIYVVMIVAVVAVVFIALAAGQFGPGRFGPLLIVLGVLAFLIIIVVIFIGQAAMLFGAFQYLRGLPVRVGQSLSRAMSRAGALIGLALLMGLALLLGFVLLIVPSVILYCMWYVAVPACVVEGLGPTASMSRSADLTSGHRWKVFGIVALLWIINLVGTQIVELPLRLVSPALASLAGLAVSALLTAYFLCVAIMTYHDLRVAKEGVDTSQIASVFD